VIVYLLYILLLDDDEDFLKLVQKYFQSKGAHVNAYSEPLLALQDFMKNGTNSNSNNNHNHYYDLIISDIRMPEMNGIELASIIRKMNKDIPIILMTASSSSIREDIDSSILKFLNIEDVTAKPIKLKELLEKVNTIKQKMVVKQHNN
jgi:CheY-like chemotaxis protein